MGWAIALHGGAGDIPRSLPEDQRAPREATLRRSLDLGTSALSSGASALDVVVLVIRLWIALVERTGDSHRCIDLNKRNVTRGSSTLRYSPVRELENCPYFNAGIGSVLNTNGNVEMEACIMDCDKRCGAVSGLTTVVNAISLARLVMERTPHIYLAFDGAEAFAREQGVKTTDATHFVTKRNIDRLQQAKDANRVQIDYTPPDESNAESNNHRKSSTFHGDTQTGTVGCVAIDSSGYFATATSTGGLVNKMMGRIGDTPVIGSGTYANNFCAVSATGNGESIMRYTIARDVAALMEYKGLSVGEAASHVLENAPRGTAGLVAVSATGEVTMKFNTTGMFRICATEDGHSEFGIWPSDDSSIN